MRARIAKGESMPDLTWVDEFIRSVRPYIYVRQEDNLLIRMPNRAFRLNQTGTRLLRYLFKGGSVAGLVSSLKSPEQVHEVALFLGEVRRALDDSLAEHGCSRAVEIKPLALGFSKLPVLAEVAVTSRCNLRCGFCYYGCSGGGALKSREARWKDAPPQSDEQGGRDPDAGQLQKIFERIRHEAKVPSVSLTGGEPAMRSDLPEIVRSAVDCGLRVNLITNGTLISRALAGRLAEAGLSSAQVSLEGPAAEIHDRLTGRPGSFESACRALGFLSESGITLHTNTTLNRINLAAAAQMPRFISQGYGLERLSMNMVIPAGTAAGAGDGLLLRYSEMPDVIDLVQAQSEEWGVEFMWYSPTPLCIFNPIPTGLGNKGCAACDGLLSVDANGDVLPCSSWKEPVGNVVSENFRDIWSSGRARSIRAKQEAPPGCSSCDSFAVCQGACPLYWRRFGYAELEQSADQAPKDPAGLSV